MLAMSNSLIKKYQFLSRWTPIDFRRQAKESRSYQRESNRERLSL